MKDLLLIKCYNSDYSELWLLIYLELEKDFLRDIEAISTTAKAQSDNRLISLCFALDAWRFEAFESIDEAYKPNSNGIQEAFHGFLTEAKADELRNHADDEKLWVDVEFVDLAISIDSSGYTTFVLELLKGVIAIVRHCT